MSLLETLTGDMRAAMKSRDKERLGTIRLLVSDLKKEQINKMRDLKEDEELAFLSREAKRRRESIKAYEEGGRDDLVAQEKSELKVIEAYLPQQLTVEEVKALLKEVIAEVSATSMKDMGKVMGKLMPKLKGRFPGKEVRPLIAELLG